MPVPDASLLSARLIGRDAFHGLATAWLRAAIEEGVWLVAPAIVLPEVSGAVRRILGATSNAAWWEQLLGRAVLGTSGDDRPGLGCGPHRVLTWHQGLRCDLRGARR